ncbi:CD209 antigen-like protein E isoform X1 [Marmota monax]|nr:CD209 antigen-like protein E isoform X1 [Marmota monax]
MSDFQDVDAQQLGALDEEELTASGAKYSFQRFGFRPPGGLKSTAGFLGRGHIPLVPKLLCLMLLAGILMAVLVKVSKLSHFYEQKRSKQEDIYQELTQAEAELDRLCRPCPWDWTFFRGHCYFFSKSQRNWNDSVTACQEVGAQLVIIKSAEEQNFLQLTSKNKGSTWMGLSDLNEEGTWLWVDGSPLFFRPEGKRGERPMSRSRNGAPRVGLGRRSRSSGLQIHEVLERRGAQQSRGGRLRGVQRGWLE